MLSLLYLMSNFTTVVVSEAAGAGVSTAVAHSLASSHACHAWRVCVELRHVEARSWWHLHGVFKNQLGDLKSPYGVLQEEEPPCSIACRR